MPFSKYLSPTFISVPVLLPQFKEKNYYCYLKCQHALYFAKFTKNFNDNLVWYNGKKTSVILNLSRTINPSENLWKLWTFLLWKLYTYNFAYNFEDPLKPLKDPLTPVNNSWYRKSCRMKNRMVKTDLRSKTVYISN